VDIERLFREVQISSLHGWSLFLAATGNQLLLERCGAEELSPYEVVNAVAGNWVAFTRR
jgi:hypothetical protein